MMRRKRFSHLIALCLIGVMQFGLSAGVFAGLEDRLVRDAEIRLREAMPEVQVEAVADAPLAGFYWMQLSNGLLLHLSADGKHFFVGELYGFEEQGIVNITDTRILAPMRLRLLAGVAAKDMVIFPAGSGTKGWIAVFTDVDCGYCRRFHQLVPELNSAGVEVRYLAFPRTGIDSEGYQKLVTAWCARDRNVAITRMKSGETLAPRNCASPVAAQYKMGQKLGVRGTPTIFFDNGQMVPGYMPVEAILARLGG